MTQKGAISLLQRIGYSGMYGDTSNGKAFFRLCCRESIGHISVEYCAKVYRDGNVMLSAELSPNPFVTEKMSKNFSRGVEGLQAQYQRLLDKTFGGNGVRFDLEGCLVGGFNPQPIIQGDRPQELHETLRKKIGQCIGKGSQ